MKKLASSILKYIFLGTVQGLFASAVMAAGVTITCPPVDTIINGGTSLSATTTVNSKEILWKADLLGPYVGDILKNRPLGILHHPDGPACQYTGPSGGFMLYSEITPPYFGEHYPHSREYCQYSPVWCEFSNQPSCEPKLTLPDTKACMQFWAK